jgi:hypothetical protein
LTVNEKLLAAVREFVAARGFTLDEGPAADIIIPVVDGETASLRVSLFLMVHNPERAVRSDV